jgi:preprotein translocase subunit SecY
VRGDHPVYMAIYVGLILFFTFFYVSITFNPTEVADNMKKYGGFIPGIRAGRPTAEYLQYVLTRITVAGAIYLALISLLPLVALVLKEIEDHFP